MTRVTNQPSDLLCQSHQKWYNRFFILTMGFLRVKMVIVTWIFFEGIDRRSAGSNQILKLILVYLMEIFTTESINAIINSLIPISDDPSLNFKSKDYSLRIIQYIGIGLNAIGISFLIFSFAFIKELIMVITLWNLVQMMALVRSCF